MELDGDPTLALPLSSCVNPGYLFNQLSGFSFVFDGTNNTFPIYLTVRELK